MRFLNSPVWPQHRNGTQQDVGNGWRPPKPSLLPPTRPNYHTHIVLFLMTIVTTVVAGMMWEGLHPLQDLKQYYRGLPYAATLLAILFSHEMGHYLTARYYGMDVTLPYFLPAPPPLFFLGTFGAFIRMKSPPQHRRALLHVGAAGPIAGFCVAVPAMIYAYTTAAVSTPTGAGGLYFGEPLLLQMISRLVIGPLPEGAVLSLNSVGMAAWFGILVTMFNLLPMGQLDGGHIVYALLGPKARYVSWLVIGGLLVMGYFWQGWFLWAIIGWFVSRRHPMIVDQYAPLNRRSRTVAAVALLIFIMCFMPVPVAVVGL